jgi:hypothetical protein
MPEWFAKTPEMMKMDAWYSGLNDHGEPDPDELIRRYKDALSDLGGSTGYYEETRALTGDKNRRRAKNVAIDQHFKRHWLNADDPLSPTKGGEFWPDLPSRDVVERLRYGMEVALKRALGKSNLTEFSLSDEELDELFGWYESVGINTDEVRPLVTSWNCVAPTGSKFFDTQAIRGPTVVEWAIATPAPVRYSRDSEIVWRYRVRDTGEGVTS